MTAQVLLRSGEEQLRFEQMKAQLARVKEASVKTIQARTTQSAPSYIVNVNFAR
jgi:hypothetical protein